MRPPSQTNAFTLLEIIIVIIIVGVLASLALPRFFRTIELSRVTEARVTIGGIRQGIERCYLMTGDYVPCAVANWAKLGLDNPGTSPNSHFTYDVFTSGNPHCKYTIAAYRNTLDGGLPGSDVFTGQYDDEIYTCGSGEFSSIQENCSGSVTACIP